MGVKKVSFGVLAFLFGSFALAKLTEGIEPVSIYLAQVMHNFSKAEADKLFQLGEQQLKSNQPSSALESFQKALPIYQQIKERLAEGHTHRSIGNAYYLLKEYTQAIAHYQQALSIAREIKNPELEARALLNLGRANAGQGNTAKAIDYYQQSLAIATANQNREVELKVLSSLAQNNPRKVKADRLSQQGFEQSQASKFEAALQSWQQALIIYREIKDPQGEGLVLSNLSDVYRNLAKYSEAVEYGQKALKIAKEMKDTQREGNALGNLGNAYQSLGNYPKAIEYHQQALKIIQEIKEDRVKILGNLGSAYHDLGNYPKAIEYHQQALKIAQEIIYRRGEGNALGNLGNAYQSLGNYPKAIEYYQQALKILQEIKDRPSEGKTLGNFGNTYQSLGNYPKAIEYHQQALKIAQEIKDRRGEGNVLGNLGGVYNSMGNYPKAIEYHQQALKITQEIKDRRGEGSALGNLGNTYHDLGNYPKAIEYHQQSLQIAQEIKNRRGEQQVLGNLGVAYDTLGNYPKAIEYHQQSLQIAQEIKNPEGEITALGNIGSAYQAMGNYPKAIEYHQQALKIAQEIKSPEGEGNALGNIGVVYRDLGDYPKAIEFQQQSLRIAQDIKNPKSESITFLNLGIIYSDLGNNLEAANYYLQSLKIAQEIKDRKGEGSILGNIGNGFSNLGDDEKAIECYQQSLKIAREIKDLKGESEALSNLGNVYKDLGNYQKAIEYHQQSLKITREIKDRKGEAYALGSIGNVYGDLGNYLKAIGYYQQTLKITQEINNRQGEGFSLHNLGYAFDQQGNLRLSEKNLFEAIGVYKKYLRNSKLKDRDKVSFFDTQSSTYRILQQVLVAQNKTDAALEITESGRTRALVDLLASKVTVNPQLQLPDLKIETIKQIARSQNATLVEYSIIYDGLKIKGKGKPEPKESYLYIWVIKPTGEIAFKQVDLKSRWQKQKTSLQDLVNKNLKDLGVAIDTTRSVSNQQSFAVGDFVRRNNEDFSNDPAWKVVAVNRQNRTLKIRLTTWEENVESIERTFAQVTKVSSPNEAYTNLQQLHKILIDPIADLLPKDPNARVTFIPQGSLFFVPFPALQDADRNYLIQKHTILTSPAIQVLDLTRKQRQKLPATHKDLLIVGNPTMPKVSKKPGEPAEQLSSLPNAEREAKQVAQLFNTQAIIGDRATKSIILQQLPKARIVHFATHGLLDDFTGGSIPGAIALAPETLNQGKQEAPNSLLTASEIFDLKLNAELVVLSACNTGVGRITGDGVIGLSRSLISAGVPSVIVSLWSIPDAPTASLMTEFYQRLQQSNDKASSLRQAMLKTMEKHPDPKNWAAFTLIGESN